jgi:hypothetical protein
VWCWWYDDRLWSASVIILDGVMSLFRDSLDVSVVIVVMVDVVVVVSVEIVCTSCVQVVSLLL